METENGLFQGYTYPAFINCNSSSNQGAECKSDCSDLNLLLSWPAGNVSPDSPKAMEGRALLTSSPLNNTQAQLKCYRKKLKTSSGNVINKLQSQYFTRRK